MKYKTLEVSVHHLERWFKEGIPATRIKANPLPDDAWILESWIDPLNPRTILFKIVSRTFTEDGTLESPILETIPTDSRGTPLIPHNTDDYCPRPG